MSAHLWLNLAAAKGHVAAKKFRNDLVPLMTDEQIKEAQQLALDWRPAESGSH